VSEVNPANFIITRKRKKYKFALFHNSPLCFEFDEWDRAWQPDVIEIGAGTGVFSVSLAENNLEKQFVAIDVKGDRLQAGARSANEKGLTNLKFLRARGDQLLELFEPHSAEKVWITFPDPFPKKRSAGRRLTHPTFLRTYQKLLSSTGALYFKTDAHSLFTWSLEKLVDEKWHIQELSFDLHESDLSDDYKYKTTYEKRFVDEGLATHFVKAPPPS
jgi:tRNA (guanine-N7-)-methyltransferase